MLTIGIIITLCSLPITKFVTAADLLDIFWTIHVLHSRTGVYYQLVL